MHGHQAPLLCRNRRLDSISSAETKAACAVRRMIEPSLARIYSGMIRKLKSGQFRLYSRKKNAETGKRRNLGTFASLEQAKQHEREVQYFKKH
jgi:hypothetical protein